MRLLCATGPITTQLIRLVMKMSTCIIFVVVLFIHELDRASISGIKKHRVINYVIFLQKQPIRFDSNIPLHTCEVEAIVYKNFLS